MANGTNNNLYENLFSEVETDSTNIYKKKEEDKNKHYFSLFDASVETEKPKPTTKSVRPPENSQAFSYTFTPK